MATATKTENPLTDLLPAEIVGLLAIRTEHLQNIAQDVRHNGFDRVKAADMATGLDRLLRTELTDWLQAMSKDEIETLMSDIGIYRRARIKKDTAVQSVIAYITREWPEYQDTLRRIESYASALRSRAMYIEEADKWLTKMANSDAPDEEWFGVYPTVKAALKHAGKRYLWWRGEKVTGLYRDDEVNPEPKDVEEALRRIGNWALFNVIAGDRSQESSLAQLNAERVYPWMLTQLAYKEVVRVTHGALQYADFEPAINIPHESSPTGWSWSDR